MQWHWGNIGSAAAGLATLIVALRLLWSAPDWYRTWKERQNAERDLAREQTNVIELERRQLAAAAHRVPGAYLPAADDGRTGSPRKGPWRTRHHERRGGPQAAPGGGARC